MVVTGIVVTGMVVTGLVVIDMVVSFSIQKLHYIPLAAGSNQGSLRTKSTKSTKSTPCSNICEMSL